MNKNWQRNVITFNYTGKKSQRVGNLLKQYNVSIAFGSNRTLSNKYLVPTLKMINYIKNQK